MPLFMQGDRIADEGGHTWALVSHANPLDVGFEFAGAQRVVAWTGWFGEGADAAAGRFPRDFRTWTPGAWKSLRERIDEAAAKLAAGGELLLRPHARHVISDPQACIMLVKDLPPGVRILLDPVSMLTPAMLGSAEDHLARAMELAPFAAAVLISGADLVDDDELRAAREGTALHRDAVRAAADRLAPDLPRILLA